MSLTPQLEAFIDGRVASGRYRSASEVVRAALRLLEADEQGRDPSFSRNKLTRRAQTRER